MKPGAAPDRALSAKFIPKKHKQRFLIRFPVREMEMKPHSLLTIPPLFADRTLEAEPQIACGEALAPASTVCASKGRGFTVQFAEKGREGRSCKKGMASARP
jgi:hypothetical protein